MEPVLTQPLSCFTSFSHYTVLTIRNNLIESSQTLIAKNESQEKVRKRKLSDFVEMYDRIKEKFQIEHDNGDLVDDKV